MPAPASSSSASVNGATAQAASANGASSTRTVGGKSSRAENWIRVQALNLGRHTAGLRDFTRSEFGDTPESPTDGHIVAVNGLIGKLREPLVAVSHLFNKLAGAVVRGGEPTTIANFLRRKHQAHERVQHIEKIWNFYHELFGQRQTRFGPWLLSTDRIALDCYQDAYVGVGKAKSIPAPPPFTYMQTGFGPATYRRGIRLRQIGREMNPFPLIQLPYHRMINPWTLGAVLHEVSHNLQTDLGLSKAIPLAVGRRLLSAGIPKEIAAIWVRWNRESFADLSGLLLGGPCIVASLMDVVGRSPQITYHFNPRGVHPTPYLRVLLSCELLRRMGFNADAAQYAKTWTRLYSQPERAGFPDTLLRTAPRAMSLVVDTMCYQPYEELGGKRLSDLFRFAPKEQLLVQEAASRMAQGTDPGVVPERFLIGAVRFALDQRLAPAEVLKDAFYRELSRR